MQAGDKCAFTELMKLVAEYNHPELVTDVDDDDEVPTKPYPCIHCNETFETENMVLVHINMCKKKLLPKKRKVS